MAQTKEGAIKVSVNKMGISIEEYLQHSSNGEKRCSKCATWKPTAMFPQNSGPKNAVSGTCLECSRVLVKKSNKGRVSPFKGHSHTDQAKDQMSQIHRGPSNHRWKGGVSCRKTPRDKLHTLAKRAVNHAVEAGRMAKPSTLPCFDCGGQAAQYHHHRGYERPHWFDVHALCKKCHLARHSADE